MIIDCGYEPINKFGNFTVSGNIYSETDNTYVEHFDGKTFTNYYKALAFWNEWMPPYKELSEYMNKIRESGDFSHYELEVGLWSDDCHDSLEFMNMSLDPGWELDYKALAPNNAPLA